MSLKPSCFFVSTVYTCDHWAPFSPVRGRMGSSLCFWVQSVVSSSDGGSVWSARPELQVFDGKYDFAALVYNSQLRGVSIFLSSSSESTNICGP